jgi:hypothetical protein
MKSAAKWSIFPSVFLIFVLIFALVLIIGCGGTTTANSSSGSGGAGGSTGGGGASNNPTPMISGLAPASAIAGAAAQSLTISGANFLSSSTVTFNGVSHAAAFVNANRLTIQLSAADQATPGAFPVVVTNPAPGGGASNAFTFTVASASAIASTTTGNTLGVLIRGANVTAYVPNGAWRTPSTGVQVVPLEPVPVALPQSIATPDTVNACVSNSVTGETVCVANGTDVYLITGATLNSTLSSGSTAIRPPGAPGCKNCDVAIDGVSNTAIIPMGLAAAPSGTGFQLLNLTNNTFTAPFPAVNTIGEGIQADPCRGILLSPSEKGTFEVFNTSTGTITEFVNAISGAPQLESAAEDCATGISVSSIEAMNQVFITDLSQATFTPGSPAGTWTAPGQILTFPDFSGFSQGTDGISVPQGSHLAIITGEDGGNQFGVLQLPATSGTGTPTVADFVAATLPNTPDGHLFEQGTEPHTIGSYTSPNDGKVYGLMSNGFNVPPTYLAVIDLQALLSAPRTPGTHTIDPSFDLLAHGVVRYVSTH